METLFLMSVFWQKKYVFSIKLGEIFAIKSSLDIQERKEIKYGLNIKMFNRSSPIEKTLFIKNCKKYEKESAIIEGNHIFL